jgi:DNA-binding PadR family transcriptional regulator
MTDLTAFQRSILHVLAGDSLYGLAVKEELEQYYGEEINHGRLYPNLDRLVEQDYVAKMAQDERTNQYHLTEQGEQEILRELSWKIPRFVEGDVERYQELQQVLDDVDV